MPERASKFEGGKGVLVRLPKKFEKEAPAARKFGGCQRSCGTRTPLEGEQKGGEPTRNARDKTAIRSGGSGKTKKTRGRWNTTERRKISQGGWGSEDLEV